MEIQNSTVETTDVRPQLGSIGLDYKEIVEAPTKNDVTLGSGGVGRATDYLYLEKHRVGHAWNHRSGSWPYGLDFSTGILFCKFSRPETPT